MRVTFENELFEYDEGGWHFVAVPLDLSEDLKQEYADSARGFGSLRVEATVGSSTWRTSVFPSKSGEYLLPVKKPVRTAEDLLAGDVIAVTLELL